MQKAGSKYCKQYYKICAIVQENKGTLSIIRERDQTLQTNSSPRKQKAAPANIWNHAKTHQLKKLNSAEDTVSEKINFRKSCDCKI